MIISCVVGGLGNQLFQYAIGRALALRHNDELVLDNSLFRFHRMRRPQLANFNIEARQIEDRNFATALNLNTHAPNILRRAMRKMHRLSRAKTDAYRIPTFRHKTPLYDATIFEHSGSMRLCGFWQSEKYFLDIESNIRKELQIKNEYLPNVASMREQIAKTRAVSVHFRRTDYVGTSVFEMQNPLDYYRVALNDIAGHFEDITFYVFSDDIAWVKANFQTNHRVVYANENGVLTDIEELHLMQNCRHHVIANSTFSWWGAWLNPDANKRVYAPRVWLNDDRDYSDVVPQSWVKI